MAVVSPYGTHPVTLGKGVVSVMGATPASLVGVAANVPCWISDGTILYQNYQAAPKVQTLTVPGGVTTTVSTSGANALGGGAGVWAAQLGGVRTSVGGLGPFPGIYLGAVSELGQIAVVSFGTPAGITVYTATGTQQFTVNTTLTLNRIWLRQNILSYVDKAGWHLVDVRTGASVPNWKPRPSILFCIPFTIGNSVGVLEYDTSAPSATALSVRLASSLNGLLIPTTAHEFNPDIQGVDAHDVRLAYSTGAGEGRTELVILDINTATKATSKGVVVGTAMVFSAGPTLAGEAFSGSDAGSLYLPVQQQPLVDPKTGTITKPWRDALQAISGTATNAISQINNLPAPPAAPSFGTIGTVEATEPADILLLTSTDTSITLTADQATKTLDLGSRPQILAMASLRA